MSLKSNPDNDAEYLDSDREQSFIEVSEKLKLAIEALKDICVWAEDLSQAKNIASYFLDKLAR